MSWFDAVDYVRTLASDAMTWAHNTLLAFGFFNKHAKILFLGLDNAGKTTLLRMLTDDQLQVHCPTQHSTSEELQVGGVHITAVDIGGHATARRLWRDYLVKVDGVVFVVDASDASRLPEAAYELSKVLGMYEIEDVPVMVLGNKVDIPSALSEQQLQANLGLMHATTGKCVESRKGVMFTWAGQKSQKEATAHGSRPVEIFMCSVVKRFGYAQGFEWLAHHIAA